jgi:hypothetical protein
MIQTSSKLLGNRLSVFSLADDDLPRDFDDEDELGDDKADESGDDDKDEKEEDESLEDGFKEENY